jgi:hypothetical protein
VATGDRGCEAYTAIAWGVGLSHERSDIAGAECFYSLEGNMCGTAMRRADALPGSKATSRAKGSHRNLGGRTPPLRTCPQLSRCGPAGSRRTPFPHLSASHRAPDLMIGGPGSATAPLGRPRLVMFAFEFCGLCGHTPAVSAGTAFERRFIGCMVAKSLILFTLCNFTHLRMKVSGAA